VDRSEELLLSFYRCSVEIMCVNQQTVERLTDGFLSHYLTELCSSKRALQELTQNQVILLDTLEHKVTKFRKCNATIDLNALFTEAKDYHSKLLNIRREMIALHDQTRFHIRSTLFIHYPEIVRIDTLNS
uniref:Biogenesis of lysosomal organelles complex-1, subunit 6, pallidin n=1 Tax=Cyprinus carpio TaxID=7962 RepID=A0A8C1GW67_CYPCA